MAKLYLAVTANQAQEVCYRPDLLDPKVTDRVAAGRNYRQQRVMAGHQTVLGEWPIDVCNNIIGQLENVGAIELGDVEKGDTKGRRQIPYVLSVDRVIPKKIIDGVHELNLGILTDEGFRRRMTSAVKSNDAIEDALLAGRKSTAAPDTTLQRSEVQFEQVDSDDGKKKLEQGIKVDANLPAGGHAAGAKRAGGRGR